MATATEPTIEQRLTALEAAVAEIRQQLSSLTPDATHWVQQIRGSMKGNPGFEEMVALGRAFRQADRPPEFEAVTSTQPEVEPQPSAQSPPTEPTSGGRIERAKLDNQGPLIPLTPEEAEAKAEAIRRMLQEIRSIPDEPDEDDAEFFRAIDSHRPHRPLFEGLY